MPTSPALLRFQSNKGEEDGGVVAALASVERAMTKPTDTLIQATAMIVAAQITARATRSASMPVMHAKATLSHEFVDVYRALEHAIGQLSAGVAQTQTDTDADMTIKINP